MGTASSYMDAPKLLDSVKVGDIIEFNRITYSHYAFYIGGEICVHVTAPENTFGCSSLSKSGKTGGKCAQLLVEIANGDRCKINNKEWIVSSRKVGVRNAVDAIRLATKTLPRDSNGESILNECVDEDYLISNRNCEGWATYWRFDLPDGFSVQVK